MAVNAEKSAHRLKKRLETIEMQFDKCMMRIPGMENVTKLWRKQKEKFYLYITPVEISWA